MRYAPVLKLPESFNNPAANAFFEKMDAVFTEILQKDAFFDRKKIGKKMEKVRGKNISSDFVCKKIRCFCIK